MHVRQQFIRAILECSWYVKFCDAKKLFECKLITQDLNPGGVNCPAADILTIIGTMVSIVSLLFFIITYLSSK